MTDLKSIDSKQLTADFLDYLDTMGFTTEYKQKMINDESMLIIINNWLTTKKIPKKIKNTIAAFIKFWVQNSIYLAPQASAEEAKKIRTAKILHPKC